MKLHFGMKIIFIFLALISFSLGQLINVPDKSTRDKLTASEFNQILDAVKNGTKDINTKAVTFNDSLTFAGDGKYWRGRHIEIHQGKIIGGGAPTRIDNINGGLAMGYSMPVAGADEVLYFKGKSFRCWDGTTNFQVRFLVCLAAAETAGETFKFDFSWQHQDVGVVMPSVPIQTYSDSGVVVAGREAAFNVYYLYFDIVPEGMLPNQMMSGKLDRVASNGDQVDGEIILLHWISVWHCNRIGTVRDW